MIDYIKGLLFHIDSDFIVVDNNGIGYKIATSVASISDFSVVGEEVMVFTEMVVREDAISLVGFSTREELKMFQLLTSVSGVGTKVGIGILSSLPYKELSRAIAEKDIKRITTAQGVGKKTAERIILELKDKVSHVATDESTMGDVYEAQGTDAQSDALMALVSLGYTRGEAQSVMRSLDTQNLSTEAILKLALRELMTK